MKAFLLILISLVIGCSASAQAPDKVAAAAFDKLINHCGDSASVIESERKRLGVRFETELLRYVDNDVEKHYWLACAISNCSEDNGRELESLALLIQLQALSLLQGKQDESSLYRAVSLHVLSAVQSQRLGFHELAITHKSEAEALVAKRPILKGGFPAMSKEDWQIYDLLPRKSLALQNLRSRKSSALKR